MSSGRVVDCGFCGGKGTRLTVRGTQTCYACGGVGKFRVSEDAVRCGACGGYGSPFETRGERPCVVCKGAGWVAPKDIT